MTTPIIKTPSIIMTPNIIVIHEKWFRIIIDITIVLSCNHFTNLIVNTELEHYPIMKSVKFSLLIVPCYEEKIIMIKTKYHNKMLYESEEKKFVNISFPITDVGKRTRRWET